MRQMKAMQDGKEASQSKREKLKEMEEFVEQEKEDAESVGVDVSEGKQKEKRPPAKASEKGEYEPMFTEETMPKLSPTDQCIIMLCTQYFLIYTTLIAVRTANQFTAGDTRSSRPLSRMRRLR